MRLSAGTYHITSDYDELASLLQQYSECFVLTDDGSVAHCLPHLVDMVPSLSEAKCITIDSGESNKDIASAEHVWKELLEINADRKSLVINLGGGMIGDLGGFVASTYKRGIDFVQIPTTLLAMTDASVGGKLGIDYKSYKNVIGVFNNPQLVLVDTAYLKTLPDNELVAGYAELIKHALIKDQSHWLDLFKLKEINNTIDWNSILKKSVAIKLAVVNEDPHENGPRKILNFGHTIGHAIESLCLENGQPILHGNAVAAGIICESYLSAELLGLSKDDLDNITGYINGLFPKIPFSESDFDKLFSIMQQDKKNVDGKISFTLLKTIGDAKFDQFCEETEIIASLKHYLKL